MLDDRVRRAVVGAVALSLLLVAGPVAVLLLWLASADPGWSGAPPSTTLLLAGGLLGVLAAAALVAAWVLAGRAVRPLARGVAEATARASVVGDGAHPGPFPAVGVVELDVLGDELSRRHSVLARRLAVDQELARDASHQLRTPLTALLMRLEEISSTDDLEVARSEAVVAVAQVERMTDVVEELGRRSGDDEQVTAPSISLDTVLASLQREYQPSFGAAARSIAVVGERDLTVRCAPGDLAQVLGTLLENALHHGAGTVSVEARRSGPTVVVEVSDEGEGVPVALAPHIFERAVSAGSSGLGLGLARDLAERNGGRLELISAAPAVFSLFLGGGAKVRR